jgi:hypothetical protein
MECDCKIGGDTGLEIVSICRVHLDLVADHVLTERERCAAIVYNHQIAFCSDACGWALDRIKDGLPADAVRVAKSEG